MAGKARLIRAALEPVYGKGGMVATCADHLAKVLDGDAEEMLHAVHLAIWDFFPGGDTAYRAAVKVMDAVRHDEALVGDAPPFLTGDADLSDEAYAALVPLDGFPKGTRGGPRPYRYERWWVVVSLSDFGDINVGAWGALGGGSA